MWAAGEVAEGSHHGAWLTGRCCFLHATQADDGDFVPLSNKHSFNLGTLGILLGMLGELQGEQTVPGWLLGMGCSVRVMACMLHAGTSHALPVRLCMCCSKLKLRTSLPPTAAAQSCPSCTATTCSARDRRSVPLPCCGALGGPAALDGAAAAAQVSAALVSAACVGGISRAVGRSSRMPAHPSLAWPALPLRLCAGACAA